jgi:hypothetical protein
MADGVIGVSGLIYLHFLIYMLQFTEIVVVDDRVMPM